MTKDTQIWIRVTPDLKAWLQQQAKAEGRTLSNYIAHELSKIRNISFKNFRSNKGEENE